MLKSTEPPVCITWAVGKGGVWSPLPVRNMSFYLLLYCFCYTLCIGCHLDRPHKSENHQINCGHGRSFAQGHQSLKDTYNEREKGAFVWLGPTISLYSLEIFSPTIWKGHREYSWWNMKRVTVSSITFRINLFMPYASTTKQMLPLLFPTIKLRRLQIIVLQPLLLWLLSFPLFLSEKFL